MDSTQAVEQFHLLFLAQLVRRLKPGSFVLKGGCNLRFFHASVRFSEDMDLDVAEALSPSAFRDGVRDVFGARPFAQVLEARGLRIERVSEPKQTDTTQRWKLGLGVEGVGVAVPTKLECSRRGVEEGVVMGSVHAPIAVAYRLPPFLVSHYDAPAALRQKIGALADRRETQARDVFDLHLLLSAGASLQGRPGARAGAVERACANALSVDFDTFSGQVLSYLEPVSRAQYDSPAAWDTLVLEVVERLRQEVS